jgi:D-sedoheptulose 7-phosphate isomerase
MAPTQTTIPRSRRSETKETAAGSRRFQTVPRGAAAASALQPRTAPQVRRFPRTGAKLSLLPETGADSGVARATAGLLRNVAANLLEISNTGYGASVAAAVELLAERFRAGNKLLIFGNGGSAADAEHICAELVGRFQRERSGLPALALPSNGAVLTAWSNDYGFDAVFERQIGALGVPGDVAWGISTSGNSPNVVNGLRAARGRGLRTVGLTGATGGGMAAFCDVLIAAPAAATPRIQEIHLITYHAICAEVENILFGGGTEAGGVTGHAKPDGTLQQSWTSQHDRQHDRQHD